MFLDHGNSWPPKGTFPGLTALAKHIFLSLHSAPGTASASSNLGSRFGQYQMLLQEWRVSYAGGIYILHIHHDIIIIILISYYVMLCYICILIYYIYIIDTYIMQPKFSGIHHEGPTKISPIPRSWGSGAPIWSTSSNTSTMAFQARLRWICIIRYSGYHGYSHEEIDTMVSINGYRWYHGYKWWF